MVVKIPSNSPETKRRLTPPRFAPLTVKHLCVGGLACDLRARQNNLLPQTFGDYTIQTVVISCQTQVQLQLQ